MAKTEESIWSATQEVGVIEVNPKKRIEVSFNMREDEGGEELWYVSLATKEFYKLRTEKEPTWRFKKNATFPMDIWHEISTLVNDNIEVE